MKVDDSLAKTGLFYYLTMKDYETKNSNQKNNKIKKITSFEKNEIRSSLIEKDIFTFEKIQRNNAEEIVINNYNDLFTSFSKLNVCDLFKKELELNKTFPCALIVGNFAWISRSHEGHYRYFSKSNNNTIAFDFIDIIEIWQGISGYALIKYIISKLNIKFMEGKWMEEQSKKYLLNLSYIHQQKQNLKNNYYSLYKYIEPHFKILETLNVLGSINIKQELFSYKGENIFFASNSYIAEFVGVSSPSTINKVINLFAVLGIINKIPPSNIPKELIDESKKVSTRKSVKNIVTYYMLPPIIDVLDNANKIAEVLESNKISYHNINQQKILKIFGEDFSNQIYVQSENILKIKNNEDIKNKYKSIIVKNIDEKGFITKSKALKINLKDKTISSNKQNSLFLEILEDLSKNENYEYVRPELDFKKKYRITKNEYVLRKK